MCYQFKRFPFLRLIMSQNKEKSLADALASAMEAHSLRINELKSFFSCNKIKLTIAQKIELEEIIGSLSSILSSTALLKVSKYLGENVINAITLTWRKTLVLLLITLPTGYIKDWTVHRSRSSPTAAVSHATASSVQNRRLPNSYASALKTVSKNKVQIRSVERLYNDKRNVLFVRKTDQVNKFKLSQVNAVLNFDPTIKINKIFENENNFKIISHDVNSAGKLKKYLERKCDLEVSEKALYDPCILISGLPRLTGDKEILKELIFRNEAPDPGTRIIRRIRPANSSVDKIIVRSSADFRDRILKFNRVFVFTGSYHVDDHVHIIKCFKCQRYGHFAKNCSQETACGICSESHITRECPNRGGTLRCINCVRGKKSSTDHTTNWNKYPYLLNAIINPTESTNYGLSR